MTSLEKKLILKWFPIYTCQDKAQHADSLYHIRSRSNIIVTLVIYEVMLFLYTIFLVHFKFPCHRFLSQLDLNLTLEYGTRRPAIGARLKTCQIWITILTIENLLFLGHEKINNNGGVIWSSTNQINKIYPLAKIYHLAKSDTKCHHYWFLFYQKCLMRRPDLFYCFVQRHTEECISHFVT